MVVFFIKNRVPKTPNFGTPTSKGSITKGLVSNYYKKLPIMASKLHGHIPLQFALPF
jgi:hypothetical protein